MKISSTGSTESWESILRKSELELLNKLVEESAYNILNSFMNFILNLMNLKVIVVKYHLSIALVN